MAYSNWGAFVYRNGERQREMEDVPPVGDQTPEASVVSGARIFVNILRMREKYGKEDYPFFMHAHHAVLGRGKVRLCGYKSWPSIYVVENETTVKEVPIAEYRVAMPVSGEKWEWYDSTGIEGTIDGYHFKAWPSDDPEAVNLELTEPDGTKWTGKSGYCMGAGYED